jgi:hypothetical protein
MRKLIATVVLAALPLTAAAQTQKSAQKAGPAPAPKRITIDDPDEVYGANPSGEGEIVTARRRIIERSLIKIREDFWQEMYKRAADL